MAKKVFALLIIPLILLSQNQKIEKIGQAEFYIANGELEKAIKIYSEIFHQEPTDYKIANRLAQLYLWTENLHGAISVYETLLNNGVSDYDVLTKLGQWYLWDGRQSDAIAVYEKLLQIYPDSVNFYKTLAKLYIWNNQSQKAIPVYEKILELDPSDKETLVELAQQYVWNDQQLKAIPLYKKIVFLFPDSLNYHWMLCQLLVWNNMTDEAKKELRRFLLKFPTHARALELSMQLNYYLGEWDEARENAKKLLEIEPRNQNARKILDEIKSQYSDFAFAEAQWFRDTNKLTRIVYPIEFKFYFNRFFEANLNFQRVELVDDRVGGRIFGYGGVVLFKYNFSRGNYFELGSGAFKYGANFYPVWKFTLGLNLFDRIYPQFSYKRTENREGVKAIENKIEIDNFTLTIYNQIFNNLGLSFLFDYGIYSDGNAKKTFGSYLNLFLRRENPRILFVGFYAFEDFDSIYANSIPYWTPNNLSTYWIELNAEQGIFKFITLGVAGAIAKNPKYPASTNYRFYGKFTLGRVEIYGLYEKYGSTVYHYRFFRAYARFRF